jgi:hypothetical protein
VDLVKRIALVLGVVCVASGAHADWLIDTPLARKIPFKGMRYEFRSLLKGGLQENRLGFGASETLEIVARTERLASGRPTLGTFDLSYTPNGPVPGVAPGLVVGMLDTLNRTLDGRRAYFGMTFREDFDGIDGTNYGDITIGVVSAHKSARAFFGASIPFSQYFRILAEHNGDRLSTAIDVRPMKQLSLKMIWRDRQILFGASIATRF